MIRALLFDCFGVLYSDTIDHLYSLVDPNLHQELRDLIRDVDRGTLRENEFLTAAAHLAHKPYDEIEKIILRDHIRNDPLIGIIKELRQDYKTALVSNVNTTMINLLFPVDDRGNLFDVCIISGEVGLIKPEREIYDMAVTKLGVLPEECLFIDDRESNIAGAAQAGMKGLLFQNNHQFESDLNKVLSA